MEPNKMSDRKTASVVWVRDGDNYVDAGCFLQEMEQNVKIYYTKKLADAVALLVEGKRSMTCH